MGYIDTGKFATHNRRFENRSLVVFHILLTVKTSNDQSEEIARLPAYSRG